MSSRYFNWTSLKRPYGAFKLSTFWRRLLNWSLKYLELQFQTFCQVLNTSGTRLQICRPPADALKTSPRARWIVSIMCGYQISQWSHSNYMWLYASKCVTWARQFFLVINCVTYMRCSVKSFWEILIGSDEIITTPHPRPHICVSESGQHWFSKCIVAYSVPSHYLNLCWVIANWTLRNKVQWSFYQKVFIHKNAFENTACETAAVLYRRRWVNDITYCCEN